MRTLLYVLSLILSVSVACGQDMDAIDKKLYDNDFSSAIELVDGALRATTDAGRGFALLLKKAEALTRSGQYDEAEKVLVSLHERARSDKEMGMVYTTHGFLHLTRGRNDLASDALGKAMDFLSKSNNLGTLDGALAQTFLGNLFVTTGQYAQAEEQLSMALLTRQRLLPEKHELVAASLNDLGLLYSFFDNDKALTHYERALSIYEHLHGKKHAKIAIASTNIGYLYLKMELYGDATVNFENALAIWNSIYPQSHPTKGFIYFSLGQTYEKLENLKSAREFYDKAQNAYQQSYAGKHPDIARVYNAIGNLEQRKGNFAGALSYFEKAVIANHPSFNGSGNPNLKEYYDGTVLLYSLLNKAQTLELDYFRKTLKFKELVDAIRTLQRCDTLIDYLRTQIRNESDKIVLGGIAAEVYGDGVRISSEAAAAAWSKEAFREQAFYFAEKSKSAVLLGAISESNAKSFAGIPKSLLEEEKQLKSAIALVSQKLAMKPGAVEERYLRSTFYELNRNYESFSKKLEKDFPAYFNLKYNTSSPTVRQLQTKLPAATALISYFIDEKNNRLYRFTVTKRELSIDDVTLPPQFDRYITGLRNSLVFSELITFKTASQGLSEVLLPKLPRSITDLVIIPTSRLSVVPFETLLTRDPEPDDSFKTLPYLIRGYSVRYEFASGLILQKPEVKRSLTPSILLCAPVTFPRSSNFADLPGTESEVVEISSLFQKRNFPLRLLVREDAAEGTVKDDDLKKYDLLHFATHGVVDEQNPELSRIHLATNSGTEDGNLYAGEIYNLQLDAQLVTLSACQTGLGKISKGEGVIGLSRALVYAGARNCMVSFWKVADQSTAMLMKDYYRILLESPSANYSATLRQAKINLLQRDEYASPFYWAPFILIGF
jgi:tetratricopeptide (TPR) repeat protein